MRSKALSKISVLLILMLLVTGCSTTGNQAPAETDSPSDENAATYPEQPVTVIIQAAAGGGTDIMARLLFSFVEKELGVPFVCENHPGAGAQVGYTKLTQSEPDGYTIGGTNTMSIVTHELTRDVPYKLKEDFQPLFRVVFDPSAVFVRADSPFTTMEELLDYATNNPEELSWGGTFLWGAHHVHLEMVHRATDAIFTYVPFDGVAETRAAILGDHIDVAAGGASEYLELVESGELRPLVIAGNERWAPLPDVPTYKELGYDIIIGSDRGFSAPAGTSRERADILAETVKKVLEDPEFLAEAEKIGIKSILAYMDVDTWTNYLYELQDTMAEFMKSGVSS